MRTQTKLFKRVISFAAALVTGVSSLGVGTLPTLSANAEEDVSAIHTTM